MVSEILDIRTTISGDYMMIQKQQPHNNRLWKKDKQKLIKVIFIFNYMKNFIFKMPSLNILTLYVS